MSRLLATATSLHDEIRNVAGLASLSLALIGFFTNQRAEALKRERKNGSIGAFSGKTLVAVLPEVVLMAVAIVALVAMAPLLRAFDVARVGHRDGALPTMFTLIWVGFLAVAVLEGLLMATRVWVAVDNRRAERAIARGSGQTQ